MFNGKLICGACSKRYKNVLSFQSWCKYHHMADNFKWLCHDYNLKPVEFLILNRECSALAWVNRAVEQRQKINSALIIASSASSVRWYLWSVCDTFGLGRETNQSINNNLSSLLGRVLWFVVNVCVCMCVSQFVQCSVHGDIIVIYRYFFLAHGSIGYHRLVCVVNLFNRSFHAKRDCCFFFFSLLFDVA